MASLHVRNLDDKIIAQLKQRAARNGRSAEAEHREILKRVLAGEKERSWEELAALSREMTKGRGGPPSEELIREDRDSR
jgi:plasmid stability protein